MSKQSTQYKFNINSNDDNLLEVCEPVYDYGFDKDYQIKSYDGVQEKTKPKNYKKQDSMFKILVTLDNEEDQQRVYEQLKSEGLDCRILTF